MGKEAMITYTNGGTVRLKNKRISFIQNEHKTMISFQFADIDEPEKPACRHTCHKGKVRDTFVQMSNEAMDLLVMSYLSFKKQKNENQI